MELHACRISRSLLLLALVWQAFNFSCALKPRAPPAALLFQAQPIAVNTSQISEEYASDPAAADERYTGRRVNFGQVAVEGISYRAHPLRMLEDFFRVDDVKFRPRYPSDLENLVEGTVVEVEGTVQGLQFGYVLVTDCWISIVSGGGKLPGAY